MLLPVALAAAWLAWKWQVSGLGWWERPLAAVARRKRAAIVVCAVLPIVVRLLLLPLFPAPEPRTHDEFSFLLGADTLLHGRVANPPHPMWVHFESMHILAQPVYVSAFPLGPAAALAVGRLLGHPWIGVVLSCSLMCGALCWALQGWLPPRWALLGAVLAILHFAISTYWMNTYWGGALAAAGGALVVGAMPRIIRRPNWRYSVTMGVGFAILANTRTIEGAALCAVVGVVTLLITWRRHGTLALGQLVLPLGAMLAATAAGLLFYFASSTGDVLKPPYLLYRQIQTMTPHFLFQGLRPEPHYNNRDLRHFYTSWEVFNYNRARNDLAADLVEKIATYWRFYFGPLLSVPLAALLWSLRNRRVRLLLGMTAAFAVALLIQVWHNLHYAAPATVLFVLLAVYGLRRMVRMKWGRCYVRILPVACLLMLVAQIVAGGADEYGPSWRWPVYSGQKRAVLLRQLEKSPGDQLVLVRYSRHHDPGYEWVYNGADIDGSKVVWARELDRGSNQRLVSYFRNRTVWLVEPDTDAPRLVPYEKAEPRPMFFIPPGAPGIESLRSVDSLRSKLYSAKSQSCDEWNYYFTGLTGVYGPDPAKGCYDGTDRRVPVTFDRWFQWLLRMTE